MIETGVYQLKEEFIPLLEISSYQYRNRRKDLFDWFKDFFDYEIIDGRPITIYIKEVYGEYEQMPRKTQERREEKIQDYDNFTKNSLTKEFRYNSKSKVAREAIASFGYDKYGHTSQRSVAARYVTPAMNKYGEQEHKYRWCYYSTYEKLEDEVYSDWKDMLRRYRIGEQEAANAFYRQEQGEDVSKEKNRFAKAVDEFKAKYGDIPILSDRWRLREEYCDGN